MFNVLDYTTNTKVVSSSKFNFKILKAITRPHRLYDLSHITLKKNKKII